MEKTPSLSCVLQQRGAEVLTINWLIPLSLLQSIPCGLGVLLWALHRLPYYCSLLTRCIILFLWWKLSLSSLGKLHQIFCQLKFLLSLWKSCFTRQKLRNWMALIAFSEYPSDIASDQHLQAFLPLKVNLCFSIFSAHLLIYGKLHQYLYCKILNNSAIIKELLSILWDEHFPLI